MSKSKVISVRIVYNRLPQIPGIIKARLQAVIMKTANDVQANAQASMSGPKSGRVYKRGRKTHQASARGEAPAIDSGKLVNSISNKMINPLLAEVAVDLDYGVALERKRDRPFMKPAADDVRDDFMSAVTLTLKGL